ncbi:MAG: MBL fold metallo-hydrolase [Phormidesmis sp.]
MKRRQLLQYSSATFVGTLGLGLASNVRSPQLSAQAQSGSLTITSLGHTSFLFSGGGQRILVNPFKAAGCAAGYAEPTTAAELVLVSSHLLDEGYTENYANAQVLDEPGDFTTASGLSVQGVSMPHDRLNGRRFGTNIAWVWNQAGIKVVHLGVAAAPIAIEDKILIGRPDVLLLPVGGGPKGYTAEEAVETIKTLNPKVIIPTHYRTQAASDSCELTGVNDFVALMPGTPVTQGDSILTLGAGSLPSSGMRIEVLSYAF